MDEQRAAGLHKVQWDATDSAGRPVGTGVYLYRLTTGRRQEARKLALIDGPAGSPVGAGEVPANPFSRTSLVSVIQVVSAY